MVSEPPKDYWPRAPSAGTAELLSIAEIERRYGIAEYRIYSWAQAGRLHVIPVGKRFKYLSFEVEALLRLSYCTLDAVA